ncbi:MAG TPA: NAD(P) transhydrogenase subunit alpha [Verrucomicrobiae bacterium]|jgi:NAD(P) transhydrogenase subunit alpha|nr:NAD(P) transhydrogenase subunit alpha [Verrucomicrobiae bacterium]
MPADFISSLFVFVLAAFLGLELIKRVSPLLHTPLMSLTNALDAIVVVAAIIIAGRHETKFSTILGLVAVAASFSNMVGGFLITDRMLSMFKSAKAKKP